WKSSGFTTTKVAFTSRSQAARQENDPANRHLLMQFLITTVGGSIAAVCSRCQSPLNYEFAMEVLCRELRFDGLRTKRRATRKRRVSRLVRGANAMVRRAVI